MASRPYRKGVGSSRRVKLTETFLRNIPTPEPSVKRLYLDTERRGFALSVTRGAKSYIVIRRVPGHKQVRFKFGTVGEMPVAEARRKAEGILARMAVGENPVAERRAARAEERREKVRGITLRAAAALALGTLKAKGRSPRTLEAFGRPLEMYLADWMDRPLAEITRADVRRRHQHLASEIARGKYLGTGARAKGRRRGPESGRASANALFRTFRSIYNRALREHPELPSNPCVNVDWFSVKSQRAAIPMTALADWYARAMKIENPVRRDYLLFVLFSGLRRESAATMRWTDVDWENRALRVPRPKGGEERAFVLPLSDFLVEILQRRRAEHSKVCGENKKMLPWVWPAESASGHIAEPREDALGTGIHDLRRTFITAATHWLKLPTYDVKLLVNHALPREDVTAGYVSPSVEQLRAPMQAVTDKLRTLCLGEPKDTRKVLPMHGR